MVASVPETEAIIPARKYRLRAYQTVVVPLSAGRDDARFRQPRGELHA
jgi:hypothetical protein